MMSTSLTSETKTRLAPLRCVKCHAPLVAIDAPTLVCPFCGATNVMPQAYREELRLTRDLDSATHKAAEQWLRLAQLKVPRWWFICAALAPFVLLTASLTIVLIAALLQVVPGDELPHLLLWIWPILIPAQLLAANIAMKNILVSGATNVGVAFAAKPPSAPGEPPSCRQCGAPLLVQPGDVVVRCIYCETESIVLLDALEMQTLRTRVASAQSSLAQAMRALTEHAKVASVETRGRAGVIAGLLVLPFIWSLLQSWNASYWSLLIALDVYVLALCVFWNIREAFLPPVTIEELEILLGPATEQPSSKKPEPPPGTRGWYDHSSDRVNFIVPLFVTLIFLAIQIMVLRG